MAFDAGYTLETFEGGLVGGVVSNLLTVAFNNLWYQGGTSPGAYASAIVSPTTVIANDGVDAASLTPATANLSGVRLSCILSSRFWYAHRDCVYAWTHGRDVMWRLSTHMWETVDGWHRALEAGHSALWMSLNMAKSHQACHNPQWAPGSVIHRSTVLGARQWCDGVTSDTPTD